jgi:hypothetical protein
LTVNNLTTTKNLTVTGGSLILGNTTTLTVTNNTLTVGNQSVPSNLTVTGSSLILGNTTNTTTLTVTNNTLTVGSNLTTIEKNLIVKGKFIRKIYKNEGLVEKTSVISVSGEVENRTLTFHKMFDEKTTVIRILYFDTFAVGMSSFDPKKDNLVGARWYFDIRNIDTNNIYQTNIIQISSKGPLQKVIATVIRYLNNLNSGDYKIAVFCAPTEIDERPIHKDMFYLTGEPHNNWTIEAQEVYVN